MFNNKNNSDSFHQINPSLLSSTLKVASFLLSFSLRFLLINFAESSTATKLVAEPSPDDTFIINLINQRRFSECSLLILQDRFDSRESANRILYESAYTSLDVKSAYTIKYDFPDPAEILNLETNLHDFHLNLSQGSENGGGVLKALMSPKSLPVHFPIETVARNRKISSECLIVIMMLNDIRPQFFTQIHNMLAPVFGHLTRKDQDFFIFKTEASRHKELLLQPDLPNKIKFKMAVGVGNGGKVGVRTICFFCEPGGNPRMLDLPVKEENLPLDENQEGSFDYFPDFVLDLNGKLLSCSYPLIGAKLEADPPWEGVNNAKRGHYKYLLEEFLMVKYNFTYNLFASTGVDGGKGGGGTGLQLKNGTWIGITGDLVSGRADVGVAIAHTPLRMHNVDFAPSFNDMDHLTFVTAQPIKIYSPAALVWPFDLGMWIGIGACTCLSILFFFMTMKAMRKWHFGCGENWSLSLQIQFLISTFLEQDSPVLPESQCLRCFVGLWFFFTMVLTIVYRSKMVTLLAFPLLSILPKTFDELAFSNYQVGFMKQGDSAYNTLAAGTDTVYVKLVAEMELIRGIGLECLEKVVKYKYGCIAYDFSLRYLRQRNFSDSETRRLVIAPANAKTYNIGWTLGFPGKSIYRLNFGRLVGNARSMHLQAIWEKMDFYENVRKLKIDWWKRTNQTDKVKYSEAIDSDNLTMKHMAGAFYILIACLVFCSAVFLYEACSCYWRSLGRWTIFQIYSTKKAISRWSRSRSGKVKEEHAISEINSNGGADSSFGHF